MSSEEEEEEEEESVIDWDELPFCEEDASPEKGVFVIIYDKYKRRVWSTLTVSPSKDIRQEALKRKGLIDGENCHIADVRTRNENVVLIRFYRFGGCMRFEPGEAALILPEDNSDPTSKYVYVKCMRTGHWNYALRECVFPKDFIACAKREFFEYHSQEEDNKKKQKV